ncbi:diguanylate cyclase (GGDEF)-like protein [Krasilnikovia cinnamomea]|uniref:Diguanylate cyclase (GGDEF)-like protein n=1 Tax=Krasilnikovia cinnamomea TaxID=349313 RepID=A0A4Q7ZH44_9ACTN|nr:GGDEF domain-containing protein [Krasilnikovia cinnamomea]RZU49523.1 diguanylate cyclase (GGDEF)-like protein [Krasilnikovia cinnamomea]
MNPRVYGTFLACGVAVAAVQAIGNDVVAAATYGLAGAAAAVAVLLGNARHRPRPRAAWPLLGAAVLASSAAHVVVAAAPAPESVRYAVDLIPCLLLVAGLAALAPRVPGARSGNRLDAAIVAGSLGLLAWTLAVVPALARDYASPLWFALGVAAPLADLAALVLLGRLVTAGDDRGPMRYLLAAGVLCGFAGDSWFTADALMNGPAVPDGRGGALVCLGFALVGAAALHPATGATARGGTSAAAAGDGSAGEGAPAGDENAPTVPANREEALAALTVRRLVLLAAAALLPPVVLLAEAPAGVDGLDAVAIGVACIGVFLLVVLRMAGLVRRVEEQARTLSRLATSDELTGVGDWRSWEAALPVAVEQAGRTGRPLSVAVLEIDHFPRFADTHGAQAGDQLLKSAAAGWLDALRRSDTLYRHSGPEFGLILTDSTAAHAAEVVARMREAMPGGQTFSAGVAHWTGTETAAQLVARADTALYRAKAEGRDRTVAAGETVPAVG